MKSGDTHFSRLYGVNGLTILHEAPRFDVCICFPHDIMHVIFEGVLPRHLKLLLRHCIFEKHFFTLQQLNQQVAHFDYGYTEKVNKPRSLDRDHLISEDKKIVQSGKHNLTELVHFIAHDLYSITNVVVWTVASANGGQICAIR